MKKLIVIAIALFGLGIVSCQKEVISPNQPGMEIPAWEESTDAGRYGDETQDDPTTTGTPTEITDPDEDEDATINKNKKGGG